MGPSAGTVVGCGATGSEEWVADGAVAIVVLKYQYDEASGKEQKKTKKRTSVYKLSVHEYHCVLGLNAIRARFARDSLHLHLRAHVKNAIRAGFPLSLGDKLGGSYGLMATEIRRAG